LPGRLQSQVLNKALEWIDGEGDKALGDRDIPRPLLRHPRATSPRRNTSYVWLDAPIGYLASLQNCAKKGLDWQKTLAERADPLHRQGHHLLPHPVLAGDAEIRRRAVQGT
jgi:methionyl-tRNA synthetase